MILKLVLLFSPVLVITESAFSFSPMTSYRNPPPFFPVDPALSSGILAQIQNLSPLFNFHSMRDSQARNQIQYQNPAENEILKVTLSDTGSTEQTNDQGNTIQIMNKSNPTKRPDRDVPKSSPKSPSAVFPAEIPFGPIKFLKFSPIVENIFPVRQPSKDRSLSSPIDIKMETMIASAETGTQNGKVSDTDINKEVRSILQLLAPPLFRRLGQVNFEAQPHPQRSTPNSKCDSVVCTTPNFQGDCKIEEVRAPLKDAGSSFSDLTGCCPIHFCTHPDGSVETHFGLRRPSQQVQEKPSEIEDDDIVRQLGFSNEVDSEENSSSEMDNGRAPEDRTTEHREEKPKVGEVKNNLRAPMVSPFDIFSMLDDLPFPPQVKDALKTGNAKIQGPLVITATFSSSDDPKNNPFKMFEQQQSGQPSFFRPLQFIH
ncbi:unnamed protein product [Allacma fusca]|uniref:Uncharacterized protein n=1 Tax=Allacma fusca TaxID=39272 RepID=A0A8J2KKQ7_9HEXA|nr:unnamed protein product [Allacma fusca]